jgi:Ricin-type beta-trefoil lectin domain
MLNDTVRTRRPQRRWGTRRAFVMAGVLLISWAFAASPANAAPPNAGIIRNWATGRCLDSDHAGRIYTLPCNGGNYQKWRIEHYSLDQYRIKHDVTGRCLDGNNNRAVYMSPCQDPNAWQKWKPASFRGDGWINVQFLHATDSTCLDSNDAGRVYTLPCNRGGFQDWRADGNM